MQADRTTRLHNLHRLNELAATGEVDIFSAHDPDELDRAQGGRTRDQAESESRRHVSQEGPGLRP
ncbi:hypothetical protein [Actinomadura napierensis]|uniref:Uncharacterized protein n=1 Tax=Actinomadura napierensis TaxID=267854 RepID=A0ABN2Y1R0_9ACTN